MDRLQDLYKIILEARAGLVSAKIASSKSANWDTRNVIISDSQVTIGVYAKGRSSRLQLNMLARRMAAINMATGMRFYWRYMRTHRNHADGPSRGYPLGVAPKEEEKRVAKSWKELPDFFYTKTRG